MNIKSKLKGAILIAPIILLAISMGTMGYYHNSFYEKVERLEIHYEGSEIPVIVNYYQPAVKFSSEYEKPPVIICFTGFEAQKDLDLRAPIEFSRRGFAVLTMELRGHGEMQPYFGPEICQDAQAVVNFTYDNLGKEVDLNRVALLGHSGGALGVLGVLDPRVNVTVAWAGPPYISGEIFYGHIDSFSYYNPHLNVTQAMLDFNETAPYHQLSPNMPRNLMVIHHVDDAIVEYDLALRIQEKTNCKLVTINWEEDQLISPLNNVESGHLAHLLLEKRVVVESINWVEEKVDYSPEGLMQPFTADQIVSLQVYLVIAIWLFSLILSAISGAFILGKALKSVLNEQAKTKKNISKIQETRKNKHNLNRIREEKAIQTYDSYYSKKLQAIFALLTWLSIVGSHFLLKNQFTGSDKYEVGINPYLVYPGLVILGLYSVYWAINQKFQKNPKERFLNIDKTTLKLFFIGFFYGSLFWLGYFAFTFGFKFMTVYPLSLIDFLKAALRVLPWIGGQYVLLKFFFADLVPFEWRNKGKWNKFFLNLTGLVLHAAMAGFLFNVAPGLVILQLSIFIFVVASIIGYILFVKTERIWIAIGFEVMVYAFIYSKMYLMF